MPGDRFLDESPAGFSWIADDPPWMERASHALADGGGVWLVDPVDVPGLDERVAAAGEPRAVLQLLAWHHRDCRAVAERLGVPLHVTPDALPGTPFEVVRVGRHETALWWPGPRVLVVPEAFGTVRYYCAPGEPLGVHPFRRVLGVPRQLFAHAPAQLLVGHGPSLGEDVPAAMTRAARRARRDLPRVVPRLATWRRG